MPKPLSMPVEAVSGKRSATNGERRKHIKQQPGGTKGRRDDWRLELGAEGSAKGAHKSTDAKLHNAVLKTLCALSQQVREVRGAVFMCWMIKQEAPEYKKQHRERPMRLEWQTSSKRGTIWNRRGISTWYLIASWPKCTTQL